MRRWSRWLGAGALLAAAACGVAVSAGYAQPPFGKGKFGRPFPELRKDKGDLADKEREAQPRRDSERKEGERKEAERKEGERKEAKEGERPARPRPEGGEPPRPSAEQRVRMLERELFELQYRMQQVIQELARAHWELAQERMGRGPGGPPFGPFGPPIPPRGPGFGGPGGPGGPFGRPMDRPPQADGLPPIERMAERLSNEQLKELIHRLRQTLEQRIGGSKEAPKEAPRGDKKPQKEAPPATDKPVKLPPVEQMSPQQIRDLIQRLQKALDERSDDKKKEKKKDD